MKKRSFVAAAVAMTLAGASALPAHAFPDYDRIERLERDEAAGGPWVEGGRSPYQGRYKVCNDLPTPVHDRDTSQRVTVMKKVCWFE